MGVYARLGRIIEMEDPNHMGWHPPDIVKCLVDIEHPRHVESLNLPFDIDAYDYLNFRRHMIPEIFDDAKNIGIKVRYAYDDCWGSCYTIHNATEEQLEKLFEAVDNRIKELTRKEREEEDPEDYDAEFEKRCYEKTKDMYFGMLRSMNTRNLYITLY